MKKLFLASIVLLFTSCGYAPMDNSDYLIVSDIESYDEEYCNYYGRGNAIMAATLTSYDFKFRDKCGKFQIGDTITFEKTKSSHE